MRAHSSHPDSTAADPGQTCGLIDSHCHLDRIDPGPFGGIESLIRAAKTAGVTHLLCACIDLEHFAGVYGLAQEFPEVSCSVGVHPLQRGVREPDDGELADLAHTAGVVAIGETGLDFYRQPRNSVQQRERFRTHIRAAKLVRKPLIIHSRAAAEDTLRILREEGAREVGGVMHCFSEDWETAKAALNLGFCISFSGILTFNSAHSVRAVAAKVPEQYLLLETDSPYLAPVPYRGKQNQPAYLPVVANRLADVRGTTLDALSEITTENFRRVFGAGNRSEHFTGGTPEDDPHAVSSYT